MESEDINNNNVIREKYHTFSLLCPEVLDYHEDDTFDTHKQAVLDELKRYRSFKLGDSLNDKSCPLEFYKNNQAFFPNLSEVAPFFFCTPASSVPSECIFSTSGLLINKKRTRLNPLLAEELLFLKKN